MESNQDSGASNSVVSDQTDNNKDTNNNVQTNAGGEAGQDPILKDHKRALDDMHKYKSKVRDLETRNQELTDNQERSRREALVKEGKFRELYEDRESKLKESETKYSNLKSTLYTNEKFNAVRAAALKSGLRPEAEKDLSLLDFESVELEVTSNGRFITSGEDLYIEGLKRDRPHWFQSKGVPVINSGGYSSNVEEPIELTPEYLNEIERKDPAKYKALVLQYQKQQHKRRMAYS